MNIVFYSLTIKNFQSIGHAEISLKDSGVVLVEGVNNYEDNVKSNGSGKTSLFSALFWCLYGKTPEGILNVKNRHTTESCEVSLKFEVDANKYKVIRRIDKTSQSVDIYINDVIQSSRNKIDCDKFIRNDILQMTSDIFLSLIYLNQGFSSRLSSLTPAGRKDRLETLTNTAVIIGKLSDKLSNAKLAASKDNSALSVEYGSVKGSIDSYQSSLDSMMSKLKEAKNSKNFVEFEGKSYTFEDMSSIQNKLDAINSEISEISLRQSEVRNNRRMLKQEEDSIKSKVRDLQQSYEHIQAKLSNIKTDAKCPACGQLIVSEEKREEIIQLWSSELSAIKANLAQENTKLLEIQTKFDELPNESLDNNLLESKLAERDKYSHLIKILPPPNDGKDIEFIQSSISNIEEKLLEGQNNLEKIKSAWDKSNSELEILAHIQSLVTKQFRTYLLVSAIKFLNDRLVYYSSMLFSNSDDCIHIEESSQKLDISVGNSSYESLSGGEKRRVDLAIMLAQRDLSRELSGMSSNLLILDEIMESMDEEATNVMLNLLLAESGEDIRSLYIISHNNYSLPVDSKIVVCKGKDQISTVRTY